MIAKFTKVKILKNDAFTLFIHVLSLSFISITFILIFHSIE